MKGRAEVEEKKTTKTNRKQQTSFLAVPRGHIKVERGDAGCADEYFSQGSRGLSNQAVPLMNSHESPYQHHHGYADVTEAL